MVVGVGDAVDTGGKDAAGVDVAAGAAAGEDVAAFASGAERMVVARRPSPAAPAMSVREMERMETSFV